MKKKVIIWIGIFLATVLGAVFCMYAGIISMFVFGGDLTGLDRWMFFRRDSFYVGAMHSSGDSSRLPLLNPYVGMLPNGSGSREWYIDLEYFNKQQDDPLRDYVHIIEIKQLAIEKGVLMVNSTHVSKNMSIAWFVLIPSQKIETGFEHEEEFRQYIAGYGIQNPRWMTPRAAYRQFKETSCLYWIPDCVDVIPER